MGYYTGYSLTVRGENITKELAERIVSALKNREVCNYALNEEYYLSKDGKSMELDGTDIVKWYEHTTDMESVSTMFPELMFCLHGEGEENGDLWNEYYQNGLSEYCKGYVAYEEPVNIKWNQVESK